MKHVLCTSAVALVLSAPVAAAHTVTIVNERLLPLNSVVVYQDGHEEEQLKGPILPLANGLISLDAADGCEYGVIATFEDGIRIGARGVDVCTNPTLIIMDGDYRIE